MASEYRGSVDIDLGLNIGIGIMSSESIISQIAINGFGGLLANLTASYVSRSNRAIKQDDDVIRRDLVDHLDAAFKKCSSVKTILSSDTASETLAIYVDQTFRVGSASLDQYDMIEIIRAGGSYVIIGEGGGGKSMFMRYLWLSYFEKSDGKIPFFLELRNMNSLSHASMSDFIFHSIIKSGSAIRQIDFAKALKQGEFVIFLDGFDEINHDRRDQVQQMILDLQEANPNLTIIVTSRADERFSGWHGFSTAYVEKLTKENSRLLIERAVYDTDLKRKFLLKFDELYPLHKDFLSNPLLAYMMLVTFSFNPDIPRRMFQFYEQAFEALYHRHDLTKGYKRVFHSNLDKISFIRLVAVFCLKTYYDENFEFTRIQALEAIEQAKKVEGVDVNSDKLLEDFVQSVCLLKMEGITYTFTHRSFQEYFSAYCISRVAVRDVERLFSKFSKRWADKVLPMVADMDPDLFREKFIIPNANKFKSFIDRKTDRKLYESFASRTGAVFTIRVVENRSRSVKSERGTESSMRNDRYLFSLEYEGEMADFLSAIESISDNSVWRAHRESSERDDDNFARSAENLLSVDAFPIKIVVVGSQINFRTSLGGGSESISQDQHVQLLESFGGSRMKKWLEEEASAFLRTVREEVAGYQKVSGAFADLF